MGDIEDQQAQNQEVVDPIAAWTKKAETTFGAKGAEELSAALSVYSEYPKSSLADPGTQIEIAERTMPHVDAVMQSLIKTINETFLSNKGLLKKDIFEAIQEIQELFKERYPNCFGRESVHSESELILEIRSRFWGYLLYLFISREKDHMRVIKQGIESKERKRKALKTLGRYAIDPTKVKEFRALFLELQKDPELIGQIRGQQLYLQEAFRPVLNESIYRVITDIEGTVAAERNQGTAEMILLIHQLYIIIRDRWMPLLREESKNFKKYPEGISRLERENDRIYTLIKEEGTRDIPMCTTENSTLMQSEKLTMQFSPVEKGLQDVYRDASVQVNYHQKRKDRDLRTDREAQEVHKVQETAGGLPVALTDPRFPVMFINRFSGKIRGLTVYPELIKIMAGDYQAQELIRRDILLYLAQIVCKPETLLEIFGPNFLQQAAPPTKKKTQQLPNGQEEQEEDDSRKPRKPYVERDYPYGLPNASAAQRAMAVFMALNAGGDSSITYLTPGVQIEADSPMSPDEIRKAVENLTRMIDEGEIVSHRRLLPLMRKKIEDPEGTRVEIVGAFEPTEKAIERAREHGRVLRKGIEFPNKGEVFYPDQIQDLLKAFGCQTIEELVQKYPNEAYVRYETWVDPEETRRERLSTAMEETGDIEIVETPSGAVATGTANAARAIIAKVKLPGSSAETNPQTTEPPISSPTEAISD